MNTLLDCYLLGVDPVYVVGGDVNGDVRGVGDSLGDDGLPVASVQPRPGDHGELSIVDPVEVPLDGVDGQLTGVIGGRLGDDRSGH